MSVIEEEFVAMPSLVVEEVCTYSWEFAGSNPAS